MEARLCSVARQGLICQLKSLINEYSKDLTWVLISATFGNQLETVKYLLNKNITHYNWALNIAVSEGYLDITILLAKYCNNKQCRQAMDTDREAHVLEEYSILLKHGFPLTANTANILAYCNRWDIIDKHLNNCSCLANIVYIACCHNNINVMTRAMVLCDDSAEIKNIVNKSASHMARSKCYTTASYLINNNWVTITWLDKAVKYNNIHLVFMLLRKGMIPSQDTIIRAIVMHNDQMAKFPIMQF